MYRKFSAIKQLELPRTKRESLTNPFVSVDFNGPEHQACLISQKKVSRIRFYSVFSVITVKLTTKWITLKTILLFAVAYVSDAMTWRLEFC